MQFLQHVAGQINLQATLSASSATAAPAIQPHHPITCTTELEYHEDGRLCCEHATTEPDDQRVKYCIDHSIALLIIEEAVRQHGSTFGM